MFSGGLRPRRSARTRRGATFFWVALFVLSIGLQYVVAASPAPTIAATGLKAGTIAGFEIDGDLRSGNGASNPGSIPEGLIDSLANAQDWLDGNGVQGLVDPADPPTSFLFRDAVDKASVPGDSAPDTSAYVGGNKETDTRDWGYFNNSGPNDKTDYRHVMAGVKFDAQNRPHVFLGAERIDTSGSMVVDFELNQKPFKVFPGAPGVAKPDRSVNDILISLEYANGGSNPEVTLYRVSAVTDYSTGQVVTFSTISDAATIAAVRSATNFVTLANVGFPSSSYDVAPFAWAEASVNLSALNLPASCLTFGQGSIRSRTGGSPSTSQLKDASPEFPLEVNTCAQLRIEKVDEDGDHIGGATFEVSPNPLVGAPSGSTLTITDNGANDSDPRNGYILIGPCEPQVQYTVTEITAPTGYIKDPTPQSKTATAGDTVTFRFENGLGSIRWEKNGPNGTSLLGGATFTITPNPKTGSGTLTVADNGPNDDDATAGEFLVTGVLVDRAGGYTIAESEPPAGYIGSSATATVTPTSADPDVSVAAGTWINLLGSIAWTKEGPDGTSLLGGATFTITPNPKTGSGTLTVVDNGANDADPVAGKFLVTDARTGTYSVQETAAPAGYILDPDAASVTVSAAVRNPVVPAGTFVNNLGKIRWLKFGPDGQTLLGGATFQVSPDPTDGVGVLVVADCTGQPCTGPDRDDTAGEFEIQGVPVGTYAITETIAPAGYVKSSAQLDAQVTSTLAAPYVVNAGSVTNTLGSIAWVKNGPDGTSLLGGATFTITPNPKTGSGTLTVVDNGANDADPDAGKLLVTGVLVDRAGGYSIAETVAPAGYVLDDSVAVVTPTSAQPNVTVAAGTWINTLGSLSWQKNGPDGTSLLGGATFVVTGGPDGVNLTVVDNGPNDANKTDGLFQVVGLKLGTYTVTETVAPAGYVLDASTPSVTLTQAAPNGTVAAGTFTNTLGSLAWVKRDAKGALLAGATFSVSGTAGPAVGFSATVEDCTAAPCAAGAGKDQDPVGGQFLVTGLKLGTYAVSELTAPAGYIKSPVTQTATLTQEAPDATIGTAFVNTLGELSWTKDKGDRAATLLGGATFSVTPNPYTGSGSLTVVDNGANDANPAAGLLRLVDVPVGTYTVVETAAPEGYQKSTATCTITVSAASPAGTPACSFSNPPIPPAIEVVKTAGTSQASQAADGATLQVETFTLPNVTYKYVVTNTGDVRLVNVTVVDDNGTPANPDDDFQAACEGAAAVQPFELAAGASVTCYAVRSVTQDTTNVVTAAGESVGEGTPVSDTDDAVVEIIGPAITIVKTAGASAASQAADGATHETEAYPSNVTYVFEVTNSGDTVLTGVSLTDNKLGLIECPKTTLAVGESMLCTATTTISADTINVATATGTSPAGQPVTSNDAADVVILTPSISVVKTAGNAADGTTFYTNGGDVLYTYVVTNTGEVDLADVTVVDDRGTASPADDVTVSICAKGGVAQAAPFSLAVGETMTCTATIPVSVDTTNVATASGDTPHATVTDTDDAVVLVRRVSIGKANDAEGAQPTGAVVSYTLTLSVVHGPIPAMTVVDDLPEDFGTPSSISDGGVYDAEANTITWELENVADGMTLTYDVTISATAKAGEYENVATITEGPCVEDGCSDDSTVVVEEPGAATLVVRKILDLDGNVATTADRVLAPGWAFTTAITNGTISAASGTTGQDGTVSFTVNVASNGVTAQVAVTETLKTDFKLLAASCVAGEASRGTLAGLTVGDVAVSQDETVTCTFVNASGETEEATATPKVTPPPTSTSSSTGDGSSGMLLVLLAIAGLVTVLGVLTPAPARARRRSRRG